MSMDVDTSHRQRKVLKLLVAILSIALVVGVSIWESTERTSPGELHPSHASLEILQGNQGCAECHGRILQSMGNACLDCHEPITEQLATSSGLHGALDRVEAESCATCHIEHTGGTTPLITDLGFALANVEESADYRHEFVSEFALEGSHDALGCEECHPRANAGRLAPGELRFLGLQQDCTTCHVDTHEGSFGLDCASCHGQEHDFESAPLFSHPADFELLGGHADVQCATCHEVESAHSVDTLLSGTLETRACADCHDSSHRPEFLSALTRLENSANDSLCQLCHEVSHETFGHPAAMMTDAFHEATGFSLTKPHDSMDCDACHERSSAGSSSDLFARLYPGRASGDCRSCHVDPHQGEFDTGFSRGECLVCHAETHFTPSLFDVNLHAQSNFSLDGAHTSLECNTCHTSEETLSRFVPTATECADCHEDVHHGEFDDSTRPAIWNDKKGCARCHSSDSFSNVGWATQDHDRWTDFKLSDGHARADCMACHLPARVASPDHRRFGIAQNECSSCHSDPHVGQFARDNVTNCADCHTDAATWTILEFDHQRDSRFVLDEHHRQLECAACHRPAALENGRTSIRYKPLETQCADCHGFETAIGERTP